MSNKVYELVTEQIIERLNEGVIPWQKPWANGGAYSWNTEKPYRGINQFLLDGGEYATFNQIKEAGGKVKKGARSQIIVFWKMWQTEDDASGEEIKVPVLRYYKVFKVGEQTEGIEPKRELKTFDHNPIEEAEQLAEKYMDAPLITHEQGGAWYKPFQDQINVPPKSHFIDINEYYSTLFHEMVHSTGHVDRLNRKEVMNVRTHKSKSYSREELVAELGASMLCGVAGINTDDLLDNSAAYIDGWLQALKNDNKMMVIAAQRAQKAADYIQGIKKYQDTQS